MSKKAIQAIHALSPAQQGMLYETIRAPASGIHIEQAMYTLIGELHVAAFEQAWKWAVERHAILRTGFVWKERTEPLQVTLKRIEVPFEYQDWSRLSEAEQQVRVQRYLREDRVRGFQLSRAPLMRLALFSFGRDTYRFVWTTHHILLDGWSHQVLLNEITACYTALSRGQAFELEPSPPYSDYLAWLKKQEVSLAEQFWRKMLHGFTRPTLLGRAQESEAVDQKPGEGHQSQVLLLPEAVTTAFNAVARRHRLTPNTILQGIWAILLSRYSGTDDVVFGMTVSGRPADLFGVETMVGLCINTVPLRVQLPGDAPLWSWFSDLQNLNAELHPHEYCSAGQIHRWSDVAGTSLLYESLLVVENYPEGSVEAPSQGLSLSVDEIVSVGAQTKYALVLLATARAKLGIKCLSDARRFAGGAPQQVLEHFNNLLHYVSLDPDVALSALFDLIPIDQIPSIVPSPKRVSAYQAPRNPIEEVVAAVWCDVLGLSQVGIETHFFEVGGHSLVATQVISRLRTVMGVEVPLRALFEAPTVAGLAEHVEQALRKRAGIQVPPLLALPRPAQIPLSFAQARLWFLDKLEPESRAYLVPSAILLHGVLDAHSFEQSLNALIRRHESLRTTFQEQEGHPVQVIHEVCYALLPVIDLQGISQKGRAKQTQRLAEQEAGLPCDLTKGPLLRTSLLRIQSWEHVLLLTLHHIITDGWSSGVFVSELTALYLAFLSGVPSPLAPLPIQYADYAIWQREFLQGEVLQEQLAYWKKQLWRAKPLALPTDTLPTDLDDHGGAYAIAFPMDLSEALVHLSREAGVTLFMLLLAAFQVLLYRWTGETDLVVGTNVANRTGVETEKLIGFFVNLLALRTQIQEAESFRDLLQQVRSVVLDASLYQELPFEMVLEHLQVERRETRTPLVSVLFVLQNLPKNVEQETSLEVSPLQEESPSARFDLAFFLSEDAQGLRGKVVYRASSFRDQTIATLVQRLEALLKDVVARPDTPVSRLKISTEEEQAKQMKSKEEWKDENRASLRLKKELRSR